MNTAQIRNLLVSVFVAILVAVFPLALLLALSGCRSVATDGQRTQVATAQWGIDLRTDERGEIDRIYIEGPPGVSLEEQWQVTTGTSPDNRAYLRIKRLSQ